MKSTIILILLWLLSLAGFVLGLTVETNLLPEWEVILTSLSGLVCGLITTIKGFGVKIPVIQPYIQEIIRNIYLYYIRKKLAKQLKQDKFDEEDYPL